MLYIILTIIVIAVEFTVAIAVALLIQGIVYQLTGFSIYNTVMKILIDDQIKK